MFTHTNHHRPVSNAGSRSRPSAAMLVAVIALFMSLGGVGYAATTIGTGQLKNGAVTTTKLHKQSVSTNKLQRNAVTTNKLADNAVTGQKVADDSLTGDDIS